MYSNLPKLTPTFPVGRLPLYITVVRRGSVQSNLLEVTPNCPSRKLPPSSQWFEMVRCGRTSSNSLQPSPWACFPLCHSDSRRFGVFEPPSNLPCRPASPYITVVRRGSVQSNFLELSPNCPSRKPPPSPCGPASPFVTVIRGGSVYSNLPKLTQTFPVGLRPPTSQWFEEVRRGRTAPTEPSL